jgi:outer membrane protein assembly factor BamD (BamD/ComL family)
MIIKNKNLIAGLEALKAKDYEEAIFQMEIVCETELDQTTIEKAQINLVAAYEQNNQIEKALETCQMLMDSKNPIHQKWANSEMPHLAKVYTAILEQQAKANRKTAQQKAIHWLVEFIKRYPQTILYAYKVKSIWQKVRQRWQPIQEFMDRTGEEIVYKLIEWFPKLTQKLKQITQKQK